ncbi:PAS domain containing protein [Nitzschia inconspicua]|uniref:PAS domain containing protein n=1 Tax=Nitzschia inconspicua TaxID=303405 RepID=A0A9K3KWP1_9STRA|nr:PAS domain containing protein [Nitzschia inconspicua]
MMESVRVIRRTRSLKSSIRTDTVGSTNVSSDSLHRYDSPVIICEHHLCRGSRLKNHPDDEEAQSGTRGESFLEKTAPFKNVFNRSTNGLVAFVLILGTATASAFVAVGLKGSRESIQLEFTRSARSVVATMRDTFEKYVDVVALIHARCRHRDFTRREFRELYEYVIASELNFKAMQFIPNVTHAERAKAEEEARVFYAEHYPYIDYQGFRGFNGNDTSLSPRWNQSVYFPIHYMEPVRGNEAAIDLDYYSSEPRIRAVNALFALQAPSMTDRLSLVKHEGQISRCGDHNGPSFGVVLMHPGVALSNISLEKGVVQEQWPRDFSSIVICIPDLLNRSTLHEARDMSLFLHDMSHPEKAAVFMGGAEIVHYGNGDHLTNFLNEISLEDLIKSRNCGKDACYRETISIVNRQWTITVIDQENIVSTTMIQIVIGGLIVLVASIFLAIWLRTNDIRTRKFNKMRSEADAEKASLILQNATQAAKTERELNDFISHEVRNPVAAAMAATNFVRNELHKQHPLKTEDSICQAKEDVSIIDNALHFINDLLRNMLDMHRAASKQLQISLAPTDLLHDVVEPTACLLYRGRSNKIEILVDCPENLFIMTDALRLKQILLNLGRNSQKFVDEGFIRLTANEIDGNVVLSVDDSGSGIPKEKRQQLFTKYQESLDVLNQGTGIGLHLCKNLVDLMGGKIYLDEDYDSGITGYRGTRFIVDLQTSSIEAPKNSLLDQYDNKTVDGSVSSFTNGTGTVDVHWLPVELPSHLSVLFVDDDPILRKLFMRSICVVAPGWTVREAASGETALQLVEKEHFDLIFCDMYMASVEKQLLGTETVSELRANGITCKICGLSANDKESEFMDAGADFFLFKPMPCDASALASLLRRILFSEASITDTEDSLLPNF